MHARVSFPFAFGFALALIAAAGCSPDGGSRGGTGIDMQDGRYGHTATALPDGRVVVIGGVERRDAGFTRALSGDLEMFDPATRSFVRVASSSAFRRAFHAAAYSNGGTPADPSDDYILVGGGLDRDPARPDELTRAVHRISTATFAVESVPGLSASLADLQAVTLADGRVAFIGGHEEDFDAADEIRIYAADGRSIVATVGMNALTQRQSGRWNHRAAFVPNGGAGFILVTGGRRKNEMLDHGVLYDIGANTGIEFPLARKRQMHTLTLLDAGTPADFGDDAIVEAGGLAALEEDLDNVFDAGAGSLRSVDVYRVASATSIATIPRAALLPRGVFFHAAATAATGTAVVIAGGFQSIFVDEDDVYHPGDFIRSDPTRRGAVFTWVPAGLTLGARSFSLRRERAMNAASSLADGTVLVTGGINGDLNSVTGAEIVAP